MPIDPNTQREQRVERFLAAARARGCNMKSVHLAAHEASHAMDAGLGDGPTSWSFQVIGAAQVELKAAVYTLSEARAVAVERLVCQLLQVDWPADRMAKVCKNLCLGDNDAIDFETLVDGLMKCPVVELRACRLAGLAFARDEAPPSTATETPPPPASDPATAVQALTVLFFDEAPGPRLELHTRDNKPVFTSQLRALAIVLEDIIAKATSAADAVTAPKGDA